MKNLLTLTLSFSLVVFLSGAASAQGKGPGGSSGASIGQGHGQGSGHDHDQPKTGSDAKGDHDGNHDGHADWQARLNERFQNDPAFAAKIQKLLPQGTDLKMAESGFKNRGQFIAALHVAKNLGIPFDQLKDKMMGVDPQTGKTTSAPVSLGKAIHELKPALTPDQANDQAKKAEKEATETEKTGTKVSE